MTSGEARWDVFLAHASADKPRARVLHQALTALGLKVFLDEESLRAGDRWRQLLPRYVEATPVFVALLSARSEGAHYLEEEIDLAVELMRRRDRPVVVPVHLEPTPYRPYGTRALQHLQLFGDVDAPTVAHRIRDLVPSAQGIEDLVPSPDPGIARGIFSPLVPETPEQFTGRDELLEELSGRMGSGATTTLVQRIQGMGGVGKTTVAAALCREHRPRLAVVWWVRAEDPTTLVADLAALATELGITFTSDEDAAQKVKRWLETTTLPWLLVFDNVGSEDALSLRPADGTGTVIVTTRVRFLGIPGSELPVDLFPDDVATTFLRNRVRERNPWAAEEDVTPAAERLGGLPLALEQAAAWVAKMPNRRFAQWVDLFDDIAGEPFPAKNLLPGQATAETTWRVSINAAVDDAPLAERLLASIAFFAPEKIPIQWLRDAADELGGASPADVDAAIEALHTYALITVNEDDTLDVHRVIRAASRRAADPDALAFAFCCCIAQDPVASDHGPLGTAALTRHAMAVAAAVASPPPEEARKMGYLLTSISRTHLENVEVGVATAAAQVAERLAELIDDQKLATLARDSQRTALRAGGSLLEALEVLEQRMVRPDPLGRTHDQYLSYRNALADAYRDPDARTHSIPLLERGLSDNERVLGPDHPRTLSSRNDLAHAYQAIGDHRRAIALHEQNLTDNERVFDPDHSRTLNSRNDLAHAYQAIGDHRRAIALHEQNLTDNERVFGSDHSRTLSSRKDLAHAHQAIGDHRRAISIFEETLVGCEQALGPDHPTTQAVRNDLEIAREVEVAGQAAAEREGGPDEETASPPRRWRWRGGRRWRR